MQIEQLHKCRDFALAGLRASQRAIIEMAMDKSGTAIMAYAFLAGLVALAAVVSFDATGTAVASMYDVISAAVIASMPSG